MKQYLFLIGVRTVLHYCIFGLVINLELIKISALPSFNLSQKKIQSSDGYLTSIRN